MSASLVGSEMCIRDRSTSPRPPRARPTARNWAPVQRTPAAASTITPASRCLLYTSDAADDM
eukprot:13406225-Alexandrium_andersonii.AAC.1